MIVRKVPPLLKIGSSILLLLAVLLLWLAAPLPALAQGPDGDQFVIGDDFELASGDRLDGDLIVFGGNVTLEEGSTVNGDIVLMGGNLEALGKVTGDISMIGGNATLGETAEVSGDIHLTGGELQRAEGALVTGDVGGAFVPFSQDDRDGRVDVPRPREDRNPIWDFLWFLLRAFLWAGLAILVALFLPQQTTQVARVAAEKPVVTAGLGLLTALVFPLGLILLTLTIIGIPAAVVAVLLLVVIWAYGITSLGTEVGRRLAGWLRQDWALPVSAGVGTLVLVLVTNGINELVFCIGWLAPLVVGALGIGAVLLTRFGTQPYPPPVSSMNDIPRTPDLPGSSQSGQEM